MQAHHFIFTRLVKDVSSTGREGFQFAFVPDNLPLPSRNCIVWQGSSGVKEKHSLFFHKNAGRTWMVLLHYFDQPRAHEQFREKVGGREGVFFCHGFMFPEVVWQQLASPWAAMDLVPGVLMNSLAEVFTSNLIDANGITRPLEINSEALVALAADSLLQLDSGGVAIVTWLLRTLADGSRSKTLLFETSPEQALALMNRNSAFIPNALKPALSWDTGMDNNNLYNNPFNLAAWEKQKPASGKVIEIGSAAAFTLPADAPPTCSLNPVYDQFFQASRSHLNRVSDIEP